MTKKCSKFSHLRIQNQNVWIFISDLSVCEMIDDSARVNTTLVWLWTDWSDQIGSAHWCRTLRVDLMYFLQYWGIYLRRWTYGAWSLQELYLTDSLWTVFFFWRWITNVMVLKSFISHAASTVGSCSPISVSVFRLRWITTLRVFDFQVLNNGAQYFVRCLVSSLIKGFLD